MPSDKKKLDRIIEICKYKKANIYLSGPSASNYIDINEMKLNKVSLEYMNYENYIYDVKNKKHKFIEKLSIIDLLMNYGKNSQSFFK